MKRSKSIEARAEKNIEEKKQLLKNIDESKKLILRPIRHYKQTLVSASDLSIIYSCKRIMDNIHLSINQGDRVALIGKNGSGKSSFIKLILGEDISFLGELDIVAGLKISYLPQDSSFLNGKMRDFIQSSGIDEGIFKTTLNQLGFSKEQYDRDLSELSSGQKKKLLMAKSLCEEAHLYIWDEPLNFIDILSRKQIEELILRVKPTMLFVEHDVSFTDKIATKKIVLY
jgi:lincosamide and streptogramin A transport system ATP-binding/permease protein